LLKLFLVAFKSFNELLCKVSIVLPFKKYGIMYCFNYVTTDKEWQIWVQMEWILCMSNGQRGSDTDFDIIFSLDILMFF
jgi:hypothetical protein